MPNDIDTLMAVVTEINAKTPGEITTADITVLIAYHRHNRARRAAGHKTLKPDRPAVNVLAMIGLDTPKPKQLTITTPTTGVRRL